jgi:hypothetical protein
MITFFEKHTPFLSISPSLLFITGLFNSFRREYLEIERIETWSEHEIGWIVEKKFLLSFPCLKIEKHENICRRKQKWDHYWDLIEKFLFHDSCHSFFEQEKSGKENPEASSCHDRISVEVENDSRSKPVWHESLKRPESTFVIQTASIKCSFPSLLFLFFKYNIVSFNKTEVDRREQLL